MVLWVKSPQSGASGTTIASGNAYRVGVAWWLSVIDKWSSHPTAGTTAPSWWGTRLNDTSGAFQQDLYYDGAVHRVRSDDLVHLEPDGAVRTATWTASALRTVWDAQPPPVSSFARPHRGSSLVEAGDAVTLTPTASTP